jgi:hypothetical protein
MEEAHGIRLDENAYWDGTEGFFRVPVHGSAEFALLAILEDAPLLRAGLDATAHNRRTVLSAELRDRLQVELNAALQRHAHQVGTGITLLTHDQAKGLAAE